MSHRPTGGMIVSMDVRTLLRDITAERRYQDQIVHVREVPAREPRYDEPQAAIPEVLRSILRRQNVHRLYTHQAQAVDAVADGRDVVVVTGTASGKTLCYNLPVVAAAMEDSDARALYMFPTKALTQDQCG
ncbi:MAG: DEAD/DEAH box helicase, partial [Planctomycetota bacterium]